MMKLVQSQQKKDQNNSHSLLIHLLYQLSVFIFNLSRLMPNYSL